MATYMYFYVVISILSTSEQNTSRNEDNLNFRISKTAWMMSFFNQYHYIIYNHKLYYTLTTRPPLPRQYFIFLTAI